MTRLFEWVGCTCSWWQSWFWLCDASYERQSVVILISRCCLILFFWFFWFSCLEFWFLFIFLSSEHIFPVLEIKYNNFFFEFYRLWFSNISPTFISLKAQATTPCCPASYPSVAVMAYPRRPALWISSYPRLTTLFCNTSRMDTAAGISIPSGRSL